VVLIGAGHQCCSQQPSVEKSSDRAGIVGIRKKVTP